MSTLKSNWITLIKRFAANPAAVIEHVLSIGRHQRAIEEKLDLLIRNQQAAYEHIALFEHARYRDSERLNRFEYQVYSQNGEDGILAEILSRLGAGAGQFVEIGVGDGRENNTVFLLRKGWRGTWLEGSPEHVNSIQDHFEKEIGQGSLQVRQAWITAENIRALVEAMGVPVEFGVLSIDIDRNTYFVWEQLGVYKPLVVVVEYNASFPPDVDWKVSYEARREWDGTMYFGASLKALEILGRELGYSLVGCDSHGVNAFFVRSDMCAGRFAEPFTAEHYHEPARYWLIRKNGHPSSFRDG